MSAGPNTSQFDREEAAIQEAYARGDIDNKEMWRQLRELQRDYRAAAEEAAEGAYRREMEEW